MGAINSSRCQNKSTDNVYIAGVHGFDYQFNIYRLHQGAIKGCINVLVADLYIATLNEDSKIELSWALEGKQIYCSHDLSKKRKHIYSGGIVYKQNYLPSGSYCVTLLNKGRLVDVFSFYIEFSW
ncbi:MAG: hypothetical protein U5N58_00865 [Actinomycetota bacterium]|nr:hypothetical protein [Actinomycetota bacterium]